MIFFLAHFFSMESLISVFFLSSQIIDLSITYLF